MVVEGSRGQVIDSVGRDLTVPDFTHRAVSFGTPRVYRVRTIPELQALKANPDAVPTADASSAGPSACSFASRPMPPGGARRRHRTAAQPRRQSMADVPVQQAAGAARRSICRCPRWRPANT